jgi:2,4-dienoyl-CoA reductase (NADPH2)
MDRDSGWEPERMSIRLKSKMLVQPCQIKGVTFRNRMVKLPQDLAYANLDGSVSQKTLDFYESLARGGVGAIIVEHAAIDSPLGGQNLMLSIADDANIPGFARLVELVHDQHCPIIQQLNHLGPMHDPRLSGHQAVSSSTLSEEYMKKTFGSVISNFRALTIPEIEDLIDKFSRAAERVRKAGFDGVEIHAHRSYLLNSFISPAWNQREDEYGCQNLENRTRFAVKVLREVRARLGEDYLIGVRIKGAEYAEEENITYAESLQIAKTMEASGADYINLTVGATHQPRLYPEPPLPVSKELEKKVKLS